MITNLPSHEEFFKVSKECLIQAFNLLFKVYDNYDEYDKFTKEEVCLEDIWKYNSGTIRTSIILLHQGIETYMKGIVAKTSPLLILEQKRSDWPTLPNSDNKNYDTLYTIAGENLLHTFCAVNSEILISEELTCFIEKVRQNRNRAIHGASKLSHTAKELVFDILKAYTYFFGMDSLFKDLKEYNYENPLFGYFGWEFESLMSYKYLDFLKETIGIKKFKHFFNFSVLGRSYFCPICKNEIDHKYGHLQSKWAFLVPNSPDSNKIHCLNCSEDSVVERNDCLIENCKGNVIDDEGTCLTCFENSQTIDVPDEND